MKRNRKYSDREKAKILSELSSSGLNVSEFGRKIGISSSTIHTWLRKEIPEKNDFIKLSDDSVWYEIKVNGVILRIPGKESPQKISEIIKELSC